MGKEGPVAQEVPRLGLTGIAKEGPSYAEHGSVLTGDEYYRVVNDIIDRVETASEETEKMLELSSSLWRLLQTRYDAPLPLWWTFTAAEKAVWLDRKSKEPLDFGSAILDFCRRTFESLKSLSAVTASGRTTLSAMAPVVGLLFDVASLLSKSVGSVTEKKKTSGTPEGEVKKVRKLFRKLKELIKELLSFTFLCYCRDSNDFQRSLSLCPAPTVSLEKFPEFLYPPFPLASKTMAKALSKDISNVAVMAEVVAVETVLLQLVTESIERRSKLKKQFVDFSVGQDEFVEKLKCLAVHSIWAGSSMSLSEMLLDLLLEKRLPVLDLLDAKEEILVRKVLFEAVLVDPPLFNLFVQGDEKSAWLNSGLDHQSVVFMKKLSVARRAVTFFRSQDEREQLQKLTTRITTWHVPPQLLKWLKSQKKQRIPAIALQDPQALTNWLVNTADKTAFMVVFDKSVAAWSHSLTSVVTDNTVKLHEVETVEANLDGTEGEALFFVDTAGENGTTIDVDSAADVNFTAAAKSMKGESIRKKDRNKKQSKVLFHRHKHASTGTKRTRMEIDDGHLTNSSGEDSSEDLSKSVKIRTKKSKHEVEDLSSLSEESDDNDDALTSANSGQVGVTTPLNSGDQLHEELQHGQKVANRKEKSVKKGKTFGKVTNGEVPEEGAANVEEQTVACTPPYIEKIAAQETPLVLSKQTLLAGPVSRFSMGKKEEGLHKDPDGVLMQKLPSQFYQETVIASVSASDTLDTQNSPVVSQLEPVVPSVSKSAKKKKPKELLDVKDVTQAVDRSQDESPLTSVAEKNVSQLEPVVPSVSKSAKKKKPKELLDDKDVGEAVDRSQDEIPLTSVAEKNVSQLEPVVPSVSKSAKKKKPKELLDDKDVAEAVDRSQDEFLLSSVAEKNVSQLEPVVPSVSKSAKKKQSKELLDDKDVAEAVDRSQDEFPLTSVAEKVVSQLEPVVPSVSKSAKKKKPKELLNDKDVAEAVDRREDEFRLSSVAEKNVSQLEPVVPSVSKSAKKKQSKELLDDKDVAEAVDRSQDEFLLTSVAEKNVSQLEPVVPSVSKSPKKKKSKELLDDKDVAEAVDRSQDEFPLISVAEKNVSQLVPVVPSVSKSAKKKKSKELLDDKDVAEAVDRSQDEFPLTSVAEKKNLSAHEDGYDVLSKHQTVEHPPSVKKKNKAKCCNITEEGAEEVTPEVAANKDSETFHLTSHTFEAVSGAQFTKAMEQSENSSDLRSEGKLTGSVTENGNASKEAVYEKSDRDVSDVPNSSSNATVRRIGKTVGQHVHPVCKASELLAAVISPQTEKRRSKDLLMVTEAAIEGRDSATHLEDNLVVRKTVQVVEARVDDVQAETEKVTGQKERCKELHIKKSSSASILTPDNLGNADDLRGSGGATVVVHRTSTQIVQKETSIHVVKSSKKKRLKEIAGSKDEGDKHQIYDTIKHELVSASANLSSADLIDALQARETVEGSQHVDNEKLTTPRKRMKFSDESNEVGDEQGTLMEANLEPVPVAKGMMKSPNEHLQGGGVLEVDGTLAKEGPVLTSLSGDILGNGQTEEVIGATHIGPVINPTKMPVATPLTSPVESAGGETEVGTQSSGPQIESPKKGAVEQTGPQAQGTPTVSLTATAGGLQSNTKRNLTVGPTMRKKQSKSPTEVSVVSGGADGTIQVKEEISVPSDKITSADVLQGRKDQDISDVGTPNAKVQVLDVEPVTSAKPSCRTKKAKSNNVPQSTSSETTDERLSPRRTRSGRTLGTPPPTPTSRKNTRKKLVLQPLDEET